MIPSVLRISKDHINSRAQSSACSKSQTCQTIDLVRVLQNNLGDDQLRNYDLDNLYNDKKELLLQKGSSSNFLKNSAKSKHAHHVFNVVNENNMQ